MRGLALTARARRGLAPGGPPLFPLRGLALTARAKRGIAPGGPPVVPHFFPPRGLAPAAGASPRGTPEGPSLFFQRVGSGSSKLPLRIIYSRGQINSICFSVFAESPNSVCTS